MRTIFIRKKNIFIICTALLLTGAALIFLPMNDAEQVSANVRLHPIYRVDTDSGKIGVSFDASWGAEHTPAILDTLDEYGVKATFFLVNIWLEDYPVQAREIALRGHEIGLHSATHPRCSTLTDSQFTEELQSNAEKIISTTGYTPALFRPPFGDYDDRVIELTHELGYQCIQWSVDSLDWQDLSAPEIFARVTKDIHSGDIILFHNNGLNTAEALPMILEYLQEHQLEAVPISQMLLEDNSYVDSNGIQRTK